MDPPILDGVCVAVAMLVATGETPPGCACFLGNNDQIAREARETPGTLVDIQRNGQVTRQDVLRLISRMVASAPMK